MLRVALLVALIGAALCSVAVAAAADVVAVPKPKFPPPVRDLAAGAGPRLQLVSTTPRSPTYSPPADGAVPNAVPRTLQGMERLRVFGQPGTTFAVYGVSLVAGFGPRGGMKYAFDLTSFGFPPTSIAPRAYGPQEVVWARQVGRLLVVQTSHLGYARDSANRNGYLTGIDIASGKVAWRSRSLVANAQNFLVVNGMVVSGYGFTAEPDWLYLLDAKTGRVRDRLPLPSMAERLTRSGERIVARCYDARVVVRLA